MRSDRIRGLIEALLAAALFALPTASKALSVFTCEPEWAALMRELAPDAEVTSATHARQDPHHVEARPSLIAQMRRADLAVCTGAGQEAGWLPLLQQRAGNPRVRHGADSMVYAADHASLIDVGATGSGHVHAEGNPHFHIDPRQLPDVARAITAQLQQIDPARRDQHAARLQRWVADWEARVRQWELRARPLRGMRVVGQHTTFAYLWRWLSIEQVADLEPQPGAPPTPGHLQRVLSAVRTQPPQAIVVASYQDARPASWLAGQLGRPQLVLQLPSTVTQEAGAATLHGWIDHLLERLLEARR